MTYQYDAIIHEATDRLLRVKALYADLTDDEATILCQWAEARIATSVSGALNGETAQSRANREVQRLGAAFRSIVRVTMNPTSWDRALVIAAMTALLSDTWNGET